MRRSVRAILGLLSVGILLGGVSGCLTGYFLEPGQSAYIGGELTSREQAPFQKVWVATRKAMRALDLEPFDIEKDGFSAVMEGQTAKNRAVRVRMKRKADDTTEIGIRILFSRDFVKADKILEEIREQVKKGAAKSQTR